MRIGLLCLGALLASGCQPGHPPQPTSSAPMASAAAAHGGASAAASTADTSGLDPNVVVRAPASAPPGVAWYSGSLPDAFALAKRAGRPVLLFWGAEWCPFCHTLKATVFARPDFIAKTRLFVPVYLDGDDAGAQSWGEQFGVLGYPTLLVLDGDRHEIVRLGAGRDVSEYATVLDAALEDLQPIDALLPLALSGKALTADECRRLAYNGWDLDTLEPQGYGARAAQLQAAAQACPQALERANLTIYAASFASRAESAAAEGERSAPSARLAELIDQVGGILGQPDVALATAPALMSLDDSFFQAARAGNAAQALTLRDRYIATMSRAAGAARFVVADQLGFIDAKIDALKSLAKPHARLPAAVVAAADRRIDTALAAEHSPYVRPGLVNASLNILEDSDQYAKAYQIAKAEIARSETPYYYQADLAEVAEKLGHKDEAIHLLDLAYHGARGPATRFQWGALYLGGLLRMAPDQTERIQDAGLQVLGELDGPDRIAARARVRLAVLDRELRAWNAAAHGGHADVLQALHTRTQQICVKIPSAQPERATCDTFLKGSA
jgi:thiol-disulfide isomerase/thioredoxin